MIFENEMVGSDLVIITWQCNFWGCHRVGDRNVKFNVDFVLLEGNDVPAFAKPASSLLVRFQPKPATRKSAGFKNEPIEVCFSFIILGTLLPLWVSLITIRKWFELNISV